MARNSLFNRGYKFAREEAKRQEEARANSGKMIYEFFLPKPDKKNRNPEADVIFLTDEPINFYMHTLQANGKYNSYVCTDEVHGECVDCDNGNRPSYKGAYLIYDLTPYEYTNDKGKKVKKEGTVRLYFAGTKVMSQLDRIDSKKGGLLNRQCTIVRTGAGTSTSYTIEPGEEVSLSRKELANILADLNDEMKELFDGSVESLYDIIEEQLKLRMRSDFTSDDEEEDEDEDYDEELVDDEDDDEDYDDDYEEDEEEEEEPPKRKSSMFKSSNKKSVIAKSKSVRRR